MDWKVSDQISQIGVPRTIGQFTLKMDVTGHTTTVYTTYNKSPKLAINTPMNIDVRRHPTCPILVSHLYMYLFSHKILKECFPYTDQKKLVWPASSVE